jgi:branched-subunit amino acid aminotransferase/4-amino-4-deoxychorismate lyase
VSAAPPTADGAAAAYLDGTIVSIDEARVSVLDRGFLWGDGVYEITPAFHGAPFRLDLHLERLRASLGAVAIALDLTDAELTRLTTDVVGRNERLTSAHPVCRVGHWVTRGIEEWVPIGERQAGSTLCILVQPAGRLPSPEDYRSGVDLGIVSTRRSPANVLDPRVKTTSRHNPILAELEGARRGSLALMLDLDGHLAEGPTFNVFVVLDGEVLTPAAEHVLPGVTRRTVLELAAELGFPAREANVSPERLEDASEVFVTASTWGVLPVRSVDGVRPRHAPGEVSEALIERLASLTGFNPLGDPGARRPSRA